MSLDRYDDGDVGQVGPRITEIDGERREAEQLQDLDGEDRRATAHDCSVPRLELAEDLRCRHIRELSVDGPRYPQIEREVRVPRRPIEQEASGLLAILPQGLRESRRFLENL